MKRTGHVSWYVNVGQLTGIIGGLILGFKTLKFEKAKAGIEDKSLKEVISEDICKAKAWWSDTFGPTKQYRHY